mmetsp:Transcript_2740/g.7004  ORF Transcript_2740/g.7004 Transcript_2740/m.7004 type:complete len:234 (+) Transcript_2740:595-1296(+)
MAIVWKAAARFSCPGPRRPAPSSSRWWRPLRSVSRSPRCARSSFLSLRSDRLSDRSDLFSSSTAHSVCPRGGCCGGASLGMKGGAAAGEPLPPCAASSRTRAASGVVPVDDGALDSDRAAAAREGAFLVFFVGVRLPRSACSCAEAAELPPYAGATHTASTTSEARLCPRGRPGPAGREGRRTASHSTLKSCTRCLMRSSLSSLTPMPRSTRWHCSRSSPGCIVSLHRARRKP